MDRLVIFSDSASPVGMLLTEATLRAVQQRNDIAVVALCLTDRSGVVASLKTRLRGWLTTKISSLFDPDQEADASKVIPLDFRSLARQYQCPILRPPQQDINHPDFLSALRKEIRPSVSLAFYCLQIFGRELLQTFQCSVNFHNGFLPEYRGLKATHWSVYRGEKETGFCFHYMTEGIDDGNLLVSGGIPVRPSATVVALDYEKGQQAAQRLPEVLQLLSQRAPGQPQVGEVKYFSNQDFEDLIVINDPSQLSSDELLRRIKLVGFLRLPLQGTWYGVTRLELEVAAERGGDRRWVFKSADGKTMRATRVAFLPVGWYRFLRGCRRLGRKS